MRSLWFCNGSLFSPLLKYQNDPLDVISLVVLTSLISRTRTEHTCRCSTLYYLFLWFNSHNLWCWKTRCCFFFKNDYWRARNCVSIQNFIGKKICNLIPRSHQPIQHVYSQRASRMNARRRKVPIFTWMVSEWIWLTCLRHEIER